jgi:hypothetical protein
MESKEYSAASDAIERCTALSPGDEEAAQFSRFVAGMIAQQSDQQPNDEQNENAAPQKNKRGGWLQNLFNKH